MKKILITMMLSSTLLILSGCGGGGGSSTPVATTPPPAEVAPEVYSDEPIYPDEPINSDEPIYPDDIHSIELYTLDYGYSIIGHNSDGDLVILDYCNGGYDYFRGAESFFGSFNTDGYTINMYDSNSGSYVIDTDNGIIEVGYNYYIFDINSDINVEEIQQITDC